MWKEFKEFIARGNVIDLAVAVIIGAAFGKIVTSLVDGVIMPPIGLALGKVDFHNMYVPLNGQATGMALEDARKAGAVVAYGVFLNNVIEFFVVAFTIFLVVRQINKMRGTPVKA